MLDTLAARTLAAALDKETTGSISQSELARRLGISQASVSGWVTLKSRPEAHFRKAIERELGIPERDWMTPDELALATGTAVSKSSAA